MLLSASAAERRAPEFPLIGQRFIYLIQLLYRLSDKSLKSIEDEWWLEGSPEKTIPLAFLFSSPRGAAAAARAPFIYRELR